MISGVHLQASGQMRNNSFLQYKNNIPKMEKFSLCLRIFIEHYREHIPLVSYATRDYNNELIIGEIFFI